LTLPLRYNFWLSFQSNFRTFRAGQLTRPYYLGSFRAKPDGVGIQSTFRPEVSACTAGTDRIHKLFTKILLHFFSLSVIMY